MNSIFFKVYSTCFYHKHHKNQRYNFITIHFILSLTIDCKLLTPSTVWHGVVHYLGQEARKVRRMIQPPIRSMGTVSLSVPGCGYGYSRPQHPSQHNRYTHPSNPLIRANHKEVNNRLLYRPNTRSLLTAKSRAKSADALLTSEIRTNHVLHCCVPSADNRLNTPPRPYSVILFSYSVLSNNRIFLVEYE